MEKYNFLRELLLRWGRRIVIGVTTACLQITGLPSYSQSAIGSSLVQETSIPSLSVLNSRPNSRNDYNAPWHLEYVPSERVRLTYTHRSEWLGDTITESEIIAAVPPTLRHQKVNSSRLIVGGKETNAAQTRDLTPAHHPIFWTRFSAADATKKNIVEASVVHDVTLFERKLVPGKSPTPVPDLSPSEKKLCLDRTPEMDFDSRNFQSFLTEKTLRRKDDESILAFGKRVHDFVFAYMTYKVDAELEKTTATTDCQTRIGHCGNYARLVAAVFRANNIPARLHFGHWAVAGAKNTTGDPHTRCDFFVPDIGWVLCDANYPNTFGNDDGRFVTFHLHGPLLVPTANWGPNPQYHLQGIYTPAVGGNWEHNRTTTKMHLEFLPL